VSGPDLRGYRGLVAEVALIVAGAIGAGVLLGLLTIRLPAGRPVFEEELRPHVVTQVWPAQLVRLERAVARSGTSELDVHTRLRPVLVEIAEAGLGRRGLRLDRDAEEARRLLGPRAWELVRPDRPAPPTRDAPGLRPGELDQVLDALEAL
jgi:hypothetical protein